MRTATLTIAVSSAVTAAAVGLGIGFAGAGTAWTADDVSDYNGTTCAPDQFYDATEGICASADGQGLLNPQTGISDPGTACREGQFYSVDEQQCATDAITNNPDATVTPEGENPADYSVPAATGIPNCAGNPADPMWICA